MFVGGRCERHHPLALSQDAELKETILRCEPKQGSNGPMTLLTVGYQYSQGGRLCIEEQRDFMYLPDRDVAETPGELSRALAEIPDFPLARDQQTDPVLLFRFSALTYNGHRIHYDGDYARGVEGYPERVVHGPLTAMLLSGLAAMEGEPSAFTFRARAPLFCGDTLRLRGRRDEDRIVLTAFRPDGQEAMTAEVFL